MLTTVFNMQWSIVVLADSHVKQKANKQPPGLTNVHRTPAESLGIHCMHCSRRLAIRLHEKMTTSTKVELLKILHCYQRRTEHLQTLTLEYIRPCAAKFS